MFFQYIDIEVKLDGNLKDNDAVDTLAIKKCTQEEFDPTDAGINLQDKKNRLTQRKGAEWYCIENTENKMLYGNEFSYHYR